MNSVKSEVFHSAAVETCFLSVNRTSVNITHPAFQMLSKQSTQAAAQSLIRICPP